MYCAPFMNTITHIFPYFIPSFYKKIWGVRAYITLLGFKTLKYCFEHCNILLTFLRNSKCFLVKISYSIPHVSLLKVFSFFSVKLYIFISFASLYACQTCDVHISAGKKQYGDVNFHVILYYVYKGILKCFWGLAFLKMQRSGYSY